MSIIQEISQKIHATLTRGENWLDAIFLTMIMTFILAGISLVPFHGDESTYILLSEDYDKIIKQHDFTHVLFSPEGNSKQYLRLSTGSILTYSIGFARDITNNDDLMNKWLWGSSWEENVRQGNMPNPRILNLARACSALMGALGIALLFLTARQLFSSRTIAWAATLILATHGDTLVNIRRSMQEGPKFLFLILTIYIASHIIKNLQGPKLHRYRYVLLGISSGLTLAAKQDIAPMLVAAYLALALIPIWKKEAIQTILLNLFYLGLATGLAYAFFLASMPVFWGWWESVLALIGLITILFQIPARKLKWTASPLFFAGCMLAIGMTIVSPTLWSRLFIPVTSMVQTRETMVESMLDNYAGQSLFNLNSAKNRLAFFVQTTLTSQVMYMEAASFDVPPFHQQINAYEASILSGRTGSPLVDSFITLLAIMGGWALLRQFNEESLLIYSLLIITAVLLLIMIPIPWQRYFLIMQIPYSLIAGVGVNQVWIWGKSLLQDNQKEAQRI